MQFTLGMPFLGVLGTFYRNRKGLINSICMYVHYNIIAHLLLAVLIVFITQLMCSRVVKVKIGYTKTMVMACYQNYICSIVSSKTDYTNDNLYAPKNDSFSTINPWLIFIRAGASVEVIGTI